MSVFKENKKLNETSLDKRFVLIGDYEDYDGSMSYGITLGEYETYEDAEEAMKEYPGYGKNIDSAYVNLEIIDLDSYEYGEERRVDDGIEEDEYKEDDYMSEYNNGANVYEIELQLDDHGFESDRDFIKFVFDSYGVSARKIDDNTWRFYSDDQNEIKSYIAYSYYVNRPQDKETVWNMYKNIKKVNESVSKDRPITSEDWAEYLNKKLGVLKDGDGYPYYVENYSSSNNFEVVVQNKHIDKVRKILSDIANEYYKEFFYSMREEKLDGNRAVFYMEVDTVDEETLSYMMADFENEIGNYKESKEVKIESYKIKDGRRVETGLSGKKNDEILNSVIGQMSDGIWENSPRMDRYWRNVEIENSTDGVLIVVNGDKWDYSNGFREMTDEEVKKFFANKIKQIIKIEMEDGSLKGSWARDNMEVSSYVGYEEEITVSDCYKAYETLLGRNISGRYKESYAVIRTGGSIGEIDNADRGGYLYNKGGVKGIIVKKFDDPEEAKKYAKDMRRYLTPGERSYYGMGYKTVKLESMDGDKYHEYYSQDEELLYLFPNEGAFIDAIDYLYQYDLMLLGRNIFENEDNLVVRGTLGNLEKFADEVLAYELHPDYLYKEDEFAGDIIDLTETDDTDMYDESITKKESLSVEESVGESSNEDIIMSELKKYYPKRINDYLDGVLKIKTYKVKNDFDKKYMEEIKQKGGAKEGQKLVLDLNSGMLFVNESLKEGSVSVTDVESALASLKEIEYDVNEIIEDDNGNIEVSCTSPDAKQRIKNRLKRAFPNNKVELRGSFGVTLFKESLKEALNGDDKYEEEFIKAFNKIEVTDGDYVMRLETWPESEFYGYYLDGSEMAASEHGMIADIFPNYMGAGPNSDFGHYKVVGTDLELWEYLGAIGYYLFLTYIQPEDLEDEESYDVENYELGKKLLGVRDKSNDNFDWDAEQFEESKKLEEATGNFKMSSKTFPTYAMSGLEYDDDEDHDDFEDEQYLQDFNDLKEVVEYFNEAELPDYVSQVIEELAKDESIIPEDEVDYVDISFGGHIKLVVEPGYYKGYSLSIQEPYDIPTNSDVDEETMKYIRNQMADKAVAKASELAALYGLRKVRVTARFSNGETMYQFEESTDNDSFEVEVLLIDIAKLLDETVLGIASVQNSDVGLFKYKGEIYLQGDFSIAEAINEVIPWNNAKGCAEDIVGEYIYASGEDIDNKVMMHAVKVLVDVLEDDKNWKKQYVEGSLDEQKHLESKNTIEESTDNYSDYTIPTVDFWEERTEKDASEGRIADILLDIKDFLEYYEDRIPEEYHWEEMFPKYVQAGIEFGLDKEKLNRVVDYINTGEGNPWKNESIKESVSWDRVNLLYDEASNYFPEPNESGLDPDDDELFIKFEKLCKRYIRKNFSNGDIEEFLDNESGELLYNIAQEIYDEAMDMLEGSSFDESKENNSRKGKFAIRATTGKNKGSFLGNFDRSWVDEESDKVTTFDDKEAAEEFAKQHTIRKDGAAVIKFESKKLNEWNTSEPSDEEYAAGIERWSKRINTYPGWTIQLGFGYSGYAIESPYGDWIKVYKSSYSDGSGTYLSIPSNTIINKRPIKINEKFKDIKDVMNYLVSNYGTVNESSSKGPGKYDYVIDLPGYQYNDVGKFKIMVIGEKFVHSSGLFKRTKDSELIWLDMYYKFSKVNTKVKLLATYTGVTPYVFESLEFKINSIDEEEVAKLSVDIFNEHGINIIEKLEQRLKDLKPKNESKKTILEYFNWSEVDDHLEEIKAGATFENGKLAQYDSGYQVATKNSKEEQMDSLEEVKEYVNKNNLKSFGIWFDKDTNKYVLDTETVHEDDLDKAIKIAKEANQKAIFDWSELESIYLDDVKDIKEPVSEGEKLVRLQAITEEELDEWFEEDLIGEWDSTIYNLLSEESAEELDNAQLEDEDDDEDDDDDEEFEFRQKLEDLLRSDWYEKFSLEEKKEIYANNYVGFMNFDEDPMKKYRDAGIEFVGDDEDSEDKEVYVKESVKNKLEDDKELLIGLLDNMENFEYTCENEACSIIYMVWGNAELLVDFEKSIVLDIASNKLYSTLDEFIDEVINH